MKILIVSTKTLYEELAWQKRLHDIKGVLADPDSLVLTVHEDWEGGAGCGLGTLYAIKKAQEKAKFLYRRDLLKLFEEGAVFVIYHTAGKGKRAYPLAASEANNNCLLKTPARYQNKPLSLLEVVIANTQMLVQRSQGRCFVFSGNQLIAPKTERLFPSTHHIELLAEESAHFLEDPLDPSPFESFSLSMEITFALLREFEKELERKKGRLRCRRDFWLPLQCDKHRYLEAMPFTSRPLQELASHYDRMQAFKSKFFRLHEEKTFFKTIAKGSHYALWDFSSTASYYRNLLSICLNTDEGKVLRGFYKIDSKEPYDKKNRVMADDNSCLIDCSIRSGVIRNSLLIGVHADSLEADNCVIVNSHFTAAVLSRSLFYQVEEKMKRKFSEGTIRADVMLPRSGVKHSLYSHHSRDSKADWTLKLPQNLCSFDEMYRKIFDEM